ncbi:MAG TPA: ABC transporter substrate-binding protein [Pyrinomonadaceae bacterium]
MNANSQRLRLVAAALVFLSCLCVALAGRAARAGAQLDGSRGARPEADAGLTPEEERGRLIYRKGEDGTKDEITAVISEVDMPATAVPCANCHGLLGEGLKEGGLEPSPVDWATMTAPRTSPLTGRRRRAYDNATAALSITSAVDPDGVALHQGMPRYDMTAEQLAALVAYLKKIGGESDSDPGLTRETIRVGAALPLTGAHAQIGESIRETLAAYFTQVNAQGGAYGRRFELVVEDSRGEPAAALEATRRLVESRRVFALVGSFEAGGAAAANEFLRKAEVPSVGPVTLSPRLASPPNPLVFYLLPSFGDQARTLVDYVAAERDAASKRRVAVVYARGEYERDAVAGLKAQARLHQFEIVAEHSFAHGRFSATEAAREVSAARPRYVFVFAGAAEFAALAREPEIAALDARLLSSVVMLGRGAFELPTDVAARTLLAYPAALPGSDDFTEFLDTVKKGQVSLSSPAFQSVAYAAARTFVEAATAGGRRLNRAALVASLEQLRDFRTGVLPPLSFGPNRRVGATGSYVVGVDVQAKEYKPLSGRLVPRESH